MTTKELWNKFVLTGSIFDYLEYVEEKKRLKKV